MYVEGRVVDGDATVIGWLPAAESDLWHLLASRQLCGASGTSGKIVVTSRTGLHEVLESRFIGKSKQGAMKVTVKPKSKPKPRQAKAKGLKHGVSLGRNRCVCGYCPGNGGRVDSDEEQLAEQLAQQGQECQQQQQVEGIGIEQDSSATTLPIRKCEPAIDTPAPRALPISLASGRGAL